MTTTTASRWPRSGEATLRRCAPLFTAFCAYGLVAVAGCDDPASDGAVGEPCTMPGYRCATASCSDFPTNAGCVDVAPEIDHCPLATPHCFDPAGAKIVKYYCDPAVGVCATPKTTGPMTCPASLCTSDDVAACNVVDDSVLCRNGNTCVHFDACGRDAGVADMALATSDLSVAADLAVSSPDMAVAAKDMTVTADLRASVDGATPVADMSIAAPDMSVVGDMASVAAPDMSVSIGDMSIVVGDMSIAASDMSLVAVGDMSIVVGDMSVVVGDMAVVAPDMSVVGDMPTAVSDGNAGGTDL